MPQKDVTVLKEFGNMVSATFSNPLPVTTEKLGDCYTLAFDNATSASYCVIQENISKGHRVRQYSIEAEVDGKWVVVAKGSAVGHKRIEPLPNLKFSKIKFNILKKVNEPDILVKIYK